MSSQVSLSLSAYNSSTMASCQSLNCTVCLYVFFSSFCVVRAIDFKKKKKLGVGEINGFVRGLWRVSVERCG